VIIRPATPGDIPFMISLERACPTAAHWSEQQYRQLFQAAASGLERLVLVIKGEPAIPTDFSTGNEGEALLGFLVARRAAEWELENIVVAPQARRNGFGRSLLHALVAHATQTNSESVFLEVRESNAAARALYQRAGFCETGLRKSYYANPVEDAILYALRLSPKPL